MKSPGLSRSPSAPRRTGALPQLGLVCITVGPQIRYRTITRTRFLSFDETEQRRTIEALYRQNIRLLFDAMDYCAARALRLYRVTSNLFPQIDHPVGRAVFDTLAPEMAGFAEHADRLGVRVLIHPDQYVVLNSESPQVATNSVQIMREHALAFDRLGLSQSAWSCMILHGGKSGRPDALVQAVGELPTNVQSRLVLENDESCYGSDEILAICRRAKVPMVFDAHHHVVREKLDSYEHPSVAYYTQAARDTWPRADWQLVHISNGATSFGDERHSDLICDFPSAYLEVPWVEVEAKGKEIAIDSLRLQLMLNGSKARKQKAEAQWSPGQ